MQSDIYMSFSKHLIAKMTRFIKVSQGYQAKWKLDYIQQK